MTPLLPKMIQNEAAMKEIVPKNDNVVEDDILPLQMMTVPQMVTTM